MALVWLTTQSCESAKPALARVRASTKGLRAIAAKGRENALSRHFRRPAGAAAEFVSRGILPNCRRAYPGMEIENVLRRNL